MNDDSKVDNDRVECFPPTTLKGRGFSHSFCEIIKQKIITVLSQPSTWRGIINSCGGITGTLALLHMINPLFAIGLPICMLLAGVVGTFTDDYASTTTKVDDVLHAAASAIKDSNGSSTALDENATE